MSKLQMTRAFLPGGKYYKISMTDLMKKLYEDYGKIMLFPGIFGRDPAIMAFDPLDFQRVYRVEGVWPQRRNLETLAYYRKNYRQDIFKEIGGLFNE